MSLLIRRAIARHLRVRTFILAVALTFGQRGWADSNEVSALSLDEAADLAVTAQPLLNRLDAQVRSTRESAIAAIQLPDPQLLIGVQDFPINTGDAYSFTRDSDTQIVAGVMQEFPRAEKRRLRGELLEREEQRLTAERHLSWRAIRRDSALAWLELWRYDQALRITRASLHEAQTQMQAVEIALRVNTATQAEFIAAQLEVGRLEDSARSDEQSIMHARNSLSRWIGEDAQRTVVASLPDMPVLPPLEVVLERVRRHPHLAEASAMVAAAQTSAELARASYAPDWRVDLGYGYRPAFSEMVMLKIGVDLPVFSHNRQDRNLAAALAQIDAAEATVEDARRHVVSEAQLNHADWQQLATRLWNYDSQLVPQSENRITAAAFGWRSGHGSLREVLDARRAALELQMARLDLQHDQAKHFIQLTYLGAFEGTSKAGGDSHE